jgi:hypothetical protein
VLGLIAVRLFLIIIIIIIITHSAVLSQDLCE